MTNHMSCSRFTISTSDTNHAHGIGWIIKKYGTQAIIAARVSSTVITQMSPLISTGLDINTGYCPSLNSFINIVMSIDRAPSKAINKLPAFTARESNVTSKISTARLPSTCGACKVFTYIL